MKPKISPKLLSELRGTAIAAALAAGKIQSQGWGKKHQIQFKGDIDLVTEVDKASEKKVLSHLKKKFPKHAILAEESGAFSQDSDFKWIVDPLDGTTNYAHGYPFFCVSIGLEYEGKPLLGVVYEPILKQLFVGLRGKGSTLNGKKIAVSQTSSLSRALLTTGFSYAFKTKKENNLNHFENFLRASQAVRRDGAAALDLCYVACGRFDGFWEFDLKPWDTAAATVILEEAGGQVSLRDGRPYSVYAPEIVASNKKLHREMLSVF